MKMMGMRTLFKTIRFELKSTLYKDGNVIIKHYEFKNKK